MKQFAASDIPATIILGDEAGVMTPSAPAGGSG